MIRWDYRSASRLIGRRREAVKLDIRIEHAAVYAANLEKTREFYAAFFEAECGPLYQNDNGFSSRFLTFGSGARLEVMHRDGACPTARGDGNGWSHLAFSVGSKENVTSLTKKITDAGYPLYSGPRETGDGYFESCVGDPDGNRVEITV